MGKTTPLKKLQWKSHSKINLINWSPLSSVLKMCMPSVSYYLVVLVFFTPPQAPDEKVTCNSHLFKCEDKLCLDIRNMETQKSHCQIIIST